MNPADIRTAEPVLVRYGAVSEVARFVNASSMGLVRGDRVVVRTHRGLELGTLLQPADRGDGRGANEADSPILRRAMPADEETALDLRRQCEAEFVIWASRIRDWKIDVELIDVERTLDRGKVILYVLNDRGPECTKLALQAAAAGLGIIEVQPVDSSGVVTAGGHGCGSGGCGSGGCSS